MYNSFIGEEMASPAKTHSSPYIIERLAKTEATGLLPEAFVFAMCTKRESVVEREALCAAEVLLSKALSLSSVSRDITQDDRKF